MRRIVVITGTDTGVGKTVLTALLGNFLHQRAERVAALKPLCSGGREDAELLAQAIPGALSLDEINPWHFRAPLAPRLAARLERKRITLAEVTAHIRQVAHRFETVLVEGAGGLLSPLGEKFATRELITRLHAEVIIVGRNQLGIVNHLRLTLEALPKAIARRARIALMSTEQEDAASKSNPRFIAETTGRTPVSLPRLRETAPSAALMDDSVRRALAKLLA